MTSTPRLWLRPLLVGLTFVGLNLAAYGWLTTPAGLALLRSLRDYAALGAFGVMLIANATIVVPVPWPAILLPIAREAPSVLPIILAGALGSTLGESVAFFLGRSGRGAVAESRLYHWVQRQLTHPLRAFAALVVLAAPPNPAFDIAGIAAGAMGLPFWMFFTAVLLARTVRLWLLVQLGGALGL
jgi:membrane protein YqaA with SNARE-associated domain